MIPGQARSIQPPLGVLWTSGTLIGLTDAQLLDRFVNGGTEAAEAAFRELLDRHGSLVMGVCRQIVRRPQDAEDAFQATFLVLVRKARSIRVGDSLAPWLYAVAYRTAHRARASASRYRTGSDPDEKTAGATDAPPAGSFDRDTRPMLHEELARLPDKYRAPIVLCHLEGKSHEEAARLLSWPVGTVSGRLSRGRKLLRERLERRGVSVSSAMLAGRWLTGGDAILSPSLVHSLVRVAARLAATASLPASVLTLTQGVLNAMYLTKIKTVLLTLAAVVATTGGVAWAVRTAQNGKPARSAVPAATPSPRPQPETAPKPEAPTTPLPQKAEIPGYPRRKNAPNLMFVERERMPQLRTENIIVAESPDGRSLLALGVGAEFVNPQWQKLSLPEGVTAIPLIRGDIVAPIFKGKSIQTIAVFNRLVGVWVSVTLRRPDGF